MADNDVSAELSLLLLVLLKRRRRRLRASCRQTWVKQWILRRPEKGVFLNLIRELNEEDPEKFRQYHRLDRASFQKVLAMVGPAITKRDTQMRDSIPPAERLAATLRFLATGESFRSLSFHFRIGERTLSNIVVETCEALWKTMKEGYLKTPQTEQEWLKIAEEFQLKWNYPFCVGAVDGKHVAIQQPAHSGSAYFNYKHFFSVLLLAAVDANYKFIYIDVGAPGRAGDAGVFGDSSLKRALDCNALNLPQPALLDDTSQQPVNYHMIGDDAFPMSSQLLKPFPSRNLDRAMRIYNYRLSRARRVVENAFGILANRFRVFLTTIKLSPEKVQSLLLATACLHNFMVENNKASYMSEFLLDSEDMQQNRIVPGSWRNDQSLTALSMTTGRNATTLAKDQRKQLMDYFMSERGAVAWQDRMIN